MTPPWQASGTAPNRHAGFRIFSSPCVLKLPQDLQTFCPDGEESGETLCLPNSNQSRGIWNPVQPTVLNGTVKLRPCPSPPPRPKAYLVCSDRDRRTKRAPCSGIRNFTNLGASQRYGPRADRRIDRWNEASAACSWNPKATVSEFTVRFLDHGTQSWKPATLNPPESPRMRHTSLVRLPRYRLDNNSGGRIVVCARTRIAGVTKPR